VNRRLARGVEDLDFFIGDEAMEAKGYAVKVSHLLLERTQVKQR
jgi:actin-related protein 3